MIHAERLPGLSNLFFLFSDIPQGLEPVRAEFKKRVTDQGQSVSQSYRILATIATVYRFTGMSEMKSLLTSKVHCIF